MTILLMDGFETYGDGSTSVANLKTRIDNTDGVVHDESGTEAGGALALVDDFETVGKALEFPRLNANGQEYVSYEWPSAYRLTGTATTQEYVVGFRYYNGALVGGSGLNATRRIFAINVSGNPGSLASSVSTNQTSGNTDLVFNPSSGTETTASGVMTINTWHYLEFRYLPKQGTGTMKIYVDGVEVMNVTSQSILTFNFFVNYGFRVGPALSASANNSGTGSQPMRIDDLYGMVIDGVTHTAQLGESRIVLLSPTSDATPNDWTPNAGVNNFDRVNGVDWDNTTYVEAASTGDDDHYNKTTLGAADAVHALQVDCVCEAIDGTPNLHLGFDNGTADEVDMGTIGTGTEVQKRQVFETDPSGSTWSVSTVNSAEATQRMTE